MEGIRAQVASERQAISLERQGLEAERAKVGELRKTNREEAEVMLKARVVLEEEVKAADKQRAEYEAGLDELRRMRADHAGLRQTLIDDEAVLLVNGPPPACVER